MSAMAVSERDEVRRLIELVPDEDVPTVRRILSGLVREADPVAWALEHAPLDDEEVTEEDIAAWEEGQADIAAGRVVSHEEARRQLGL